MNYSSFSFAKAASSFVSLSVTTDNLFLTKTNMTETTGDFWGGSSLDYDSIKFWRTLRGYYIVVLCVQVNLWDLLFEVDHQRGLLHCRNKTHFFFQAELSDVEVIQWTLTANVCILRVSCWSILVFQADYAIHVSLCQIDLRWFSLATQCSPTE